MKIFLKGLTYFAFWIAVGYLTDPGWTALLFVLVTFLIFEFENKARKGEIAKQEVRFDQHDAARDRLLSRIESLERMIHK